MLQSEAQDLLSFVRKTEAIRLQYYIDMQKQLFLHDRELPEEALQRKLVAWLQHHDQETCHLTGVLPLVKGLPVRLTDNVDRDLQMYRGRRCDIYGWLPHPECCVEEVDGGGELLEDPPRRQARSCYLGAG